MPPPGTIPSATAARVAASAPSVRWRFSSSTTSVARADVDHRELGGQLGQPLARDLAVVLVRRALGLLADLPEPRAHRLGAAGALDERARVLGDDHAPRAAEVLAADVLERQARPRR